MKMRLTLKLAAVVTLLLAAPARAQTLVTEVRGQGTDFFFPDEAEQDHISISAWLDVDGNARGSIVWTTVVHRFDNPGRGTSGYPWYIDVTDLVGIGNTAIVRGVVVYSPQAPEDEGTLVWFTIVDNGSGAADSPDEIGLGSLSTAPLMIGNFTVR